MGIRGWWLWALVMAGAGLALAPVRSASQPLPSYNIDPASITLSGISSGGYMAHQLHVAYSATITGTAVFAGGPYHCAGDGYPFNLWRTMNKCMDYRDWVPFFGPSAVESSVTATQAEAGNGTIDDPANLRDDKVYLFSGTEDETVPQAVMDTLEGYYREFVAAEHIAYVKDIPAGHAMITDDYGGACGASEAPFINDCDFDAAGELLQHLYGPLDTPGEWRGAALHTFDQAEFVDDPQAHGMNALGHVYVPEACAARARCRLHVAFHGCHQYEGEIADAFYTRAGYNEWAEANNIIVLYPQAAPLTTLWFPWPNPAGCWDWWGYTGEDYHVKSGAQMAAVKGMIDRLTGH